MSDDIPLDEFGLLKKGRDDERMRISSLLDSSKKKVERADNKSGISRFRCLDCHEEFFGKGTKLGECKKQGHLVIKMRKGEIDGWINAFKYIKKRVGRVD